MLKHQKKKNYKKKISKKRLERLKRVRKLFKLTSTIFNPTYQALKKLNFKKSFVVNIKIKPNNIFCTLKHKDKTLYLLSAGKSTGKNISKKTLKYKSQILINEFFKKVESFLKFNNFIINIIGTKKIRTLTLKNLTKYITNKKILLNINQKKCFNGCRPPKKRRKRQKELRIFK